MEHADYKDADRYGQVSLRYWVLTGRFCSPFLWVRLYPAWPKHSLHIFVLIDGRDT